MSKEHRQERREQRPIQAPVIQMSGRTETPEEAAERKETSAERNVERPCEGCAAVWVTTPSGPGRMHTEDCPVVEAMRVSAKVAKAPKGGPVIFRAETAETQGLAQRARTLKAAHLLCRAVLALPERHPVVTLLRSAANNVLLSQGPSLEQQDSLTLCAEVLALDPHEPAIGATRDVRAAVEVLQP